MTSPDHHDNDYPSTSRSDTVQHEESAAKERLKQGSDGWNLVDHIRGAIYGNCIGDAIGLLTEFMTKDEANRYYGDHKDNLEYSLKVSDRHRERWLTGDWTDDSDQMILILLMLLQKGKVDEVDYGKRLKKWATDGFPELGDLAGCGIGSTTHYVLSSPMFDTNPHQAAWDIWDKTGRFVAPNGAVMRTSILGVYQFHDIEKVKENTLKICKVTHADPRCQASCVAVTTAIAFMLQRNKQHMKTDSIYNIDEIISESYQQARACLHGVDQQYEKELHFHMYAESLQELKLDEERKIGYTYKTLGAGFWALRQDDFKKALQEIVMEAGDADTNGAVAGALLGCKLGLKELPLAWFHGLRHKKWLDERLDRFFPMVVPKEDCSS